jgi:hypothetical protein
MLSGKRAGGTKKKYTAKGEGHRGFSKAESHPLRYRKSEGSPKDVGAGVNANMMGTSSNIPPDFEEAARSTAAQDGNISDGRGD